MADARKTNSRAKEFDLMFGLLKSPEKLAYQIARSPKGATVDLEGIRFEYGNIARLVDHLDASEPSKPFNFQVKYVCHLDGVPASRKRVIEKDFGLVQGAISSKDTKADLLVIDKRGNSYFISVKDPNKPSKLGQKSGAVSYGNARLHGGLKGVSIGELKVPKVIRYKDTNLTEKSFSKATHSDQVFAYVKKQYPSDWMKIVATSEKRAFNEIKKFCSVLKDDRNSLIDFICLTMGGSLGEDSNFYIVSGDDVTNLSAVVKAFRTKPFKVILKDHSPRGKTSIIVKVEFKNKAYCLTKIEPSFEGKKSDVSQTKGIIYHFQHYQDDGNDWKKLFFDITK
jgi:hypothetical protein